jgi:hypothetical protein
MSETYQKLYNVRYMRDLSPSAIRWFDGRLKRLVGTCTNPECRNTGRVLIPGVGGLAHIKIEVNCPECAILCNNLGTFTRLWCGSGSTIKVPETLWDVSLSDHPKAEFSLSPHENWGFFGGTYEGMENVTRLYRHMVNDAVNGFYTMKVGGKYTPQFTGRRYMFGDRGIYYGHLSDLLKSIREFEWTKHEHYNDFTRLHLNEEIILKAKSNGIRPALFLVSTSEPKIYPETKAAFESILRGLWGVGGQLVLFSTSPKSTFESLWGPDITGYLEKLELSSGSLKIASSAPELVETSSSQKTWNGKRVAAEQDEKQRSMRARADRMV